MKLRNLEFSLAVFALLNVFSHAQAFGGFITQYSSRGSFNSSVTTPLTVEDFGTTSHNVTSGVLNSTTSPGLVKPGVTYSTVLRYSYPLFLDTGDIFGNPNGYAGAFLAGLNPDHGFGLANNALTITFDTPVSAFGLDKGATSRWIAEIFFSSGPSQVFVNEMPSSMSFYGYKSSLTDIVSVKITNTSSIVQFDLDNFTFISPVQAVPEPTSIAVYALLIGSVVPALRLRGKSKKVQQAK